MDIQRLAVAGTEFDADDPRLQAVLASAYESPERPRCLCASGGVEMYVARHRQYVVKRMPGSGMRHHPGCPSYEPDAQQSGLGELVGEAVFEPSPGSFELCVNFPWTRVTGRAVPRGESQEPVEVVVARRRMSLRALMHFLFERAGINRWSPAMEGKRNQGVLHKYLMEAADSVTVRGLTLAERLYVPEPFSEAGREDAARRRRQKLAVLHPREGQSPLAIALGEFKACDATPQGCRIWIKHAPDAPLLATVRTWERIERTFRSLLEARHADTGHRVRVVIAALIRARREHTYEIDAASLMLTNEQWIPLGGVHELSLVHALIAQQRRFIKPLRYDARNVASFPNALLLDAGAQPRPLHVVSAFMSAKDRAARKRPRGRWTVLGCGATMSPCHPCLPLSVFMGGSCGDAVRRALVAALRRGGVRACADGDHYLQHVFKARTIEVVAEVTGIHADVLLRPLKKDATTAYAERAVAAKGWLPAVLRLRPFDGESLARVGTSTL